MNESCKACIREKQLKKAESFGSSKEKEQYMAGVDRIIKEHSAECSTPEISEIINSFYESFSGRKDDFTEAKHKYNMLLYKKEESITREIEKAENPLEECIKYVCAGNYIDFSAVENVNEDTFFALMEKAKKQETDREEFSYFIKDLEKAQSLIYLTDNCGEIVLDKIFIKFIKKYFPDLRITVILRGKDTINDATLDDAREIHLDEIALCMGNGSGAPGTVMKKLPENIKKIITSADVIISKGQGNFESLFREGLNPYYMFLCKCELFRKRFGIEKFSSVFRKEERIKA